MPPSSMHAGCDEQACVNVLSIVCFSGVQGKVVWEGTVEEFDNSEVPIVRQFASGSLVGPIRYE